MGVVEPTTRSTRSKAGSIDLEPAFGSGFGSGGRPTGSGNAMLAQRRTGPSAFMKRR
jgi:hypothetical protein